MILILLFLFLTACTSPHYFIQRPDRFSIYRGVNFHVVTQQRVWSECGFPRSGCLRIEGNIARVWVIDNSYAFRHECDHVDALLAGKSLAGEHVKDALMSLSGFNDVMLLASAPFPAPRICPATK